MERDSRRITRFNVQIYDDGWNPPYEVIEEIEYRITEARASAVQRVKRDRALHRGGWLTTEVARKYAAKSWIYRVVEGNQYVGEVRRIGDELRELYGVTELEAINILFEHNVNDYVTKYYRMKNEIPDYVSDQYICNRVIEQYREAM